MIAGIESDDALRTTALLNTIATSVATIATAERCVRVISENSSDCGAGALALRPGDRSTR